MKTAFKVNWVVLIVAVLAAVTIAALWFLGQLDPTVAIEFLKIIGPIIIGTAPIFGAISSAKSYSKSSLASEAEAAPITPEQRQSLMLLLARLLIALVKVFVPNAKSK